MSKFDSYASNVDRHIEIGTGTFGSAFAGSLPVESRRFQVSLGGTFTSTDNLGFFTRAWQEPAYRITGVVINFKKTEDD